MNALAGRTVFACDHRIALAEPAAEDTEVLTAGGDGAFAVDEGDSPLPLTVDVTRASIVDSTTGTLLGPISWHFVAHGPTSPYLAHHLGTILLPAARGHGTGALATSLLAQHLFATTDVFRLELATDTANTSAQRAAERAGFTREGVLRGAQQRGGRRRGLHSYSLLRTDV